jgi:hypothetical protein
MNDLDTLIGYEPEHQTLVAYENGGKLDVFDGTTFLGGFSKLEAYCSNLRIRIVEATR